MLCVGAAQISNGTVSFSDGILMFSDCVVTFSSSEHFLQLYNVKGVKVVRKLFKKRHLKYFTVSMSLLPLCT